MDAVDIDIITLSKWFNLDPDVVKNWDITAFADRQEYMFIIDDIKNSDVADDDEGTEYYTPKNKK